MKRFEIPTAEKCMSQHAPSETDAIGEGNGTLQLGRYAEEASPQELVHVPPELASCWLLGSSKALAE